MNGNVLRGQPHQSYPGFGGPLNVASPSVNPAASFPQIYFKATGPSTSRSGSRTVGLSSEERASKRVRYGGESVPASLAEAMRNGGMPSDSSIDNSTGWMSNGRVPYARFSHPFDLEAFKSFQYGQLIFTVRNMQMPRVWRRGKVNMSMTPLLTLQGVNYTLAHEQHNGNITAPGYRFPTVSEAMAAFSLDGVGIVQDGGDDWRAYTEIGQETVHLINMCVGGSVQGVLKHWGNDILPGTRLFLIVKRVPLPAELIADGYNIDAKVGNLAVKRTPTTVQRPFQVIPWCSTIYEKPPPRMLRYENDLGYEETGGYIYVGTVDEPGEIKHPRKALGEVWHSSKAAYNRGQFEVMLNIGPLIVD